MPLQTDKHCRRPAARQAHSPPNPAPLRLSPFPACLTSLTSLTPEWQRQHLALAPLQVLWAQQAQQQDAKGEGCQQQAERSGAGGTRSRRHGRCQGEAGSSYKQLMAVLPGLIHQSSILEYGMQLCNYRSSSPRHQPTVAATVRTTPLPPCPRVPAPLLTLRLSMARPRSSPLPTMSSSNTRIRTRSAWGSLRPHRSRRCTAAGGAQARNQSVVAEPGAQPVGCTGPEGEGSPGGGGGGGGPAPTGMVVGA